MTDVASPPRPAGSGPGADLPLARLRRLADAMPQLVWTAWSDGTVDYYNSRATEYAGLERVDGTWRWEPIVHPDEAEATAAAWRAAVAAEETYEFEHRLRMADGSFRWHLSRAVPTREPELEGLVWYGTATDIHDLKEAQEALLDRDERLRIALGAAEQSHDAIVVWDTDRGIVFWNRGAEELYGWPADEVLGRETHELLGTTGHPDDFDARLAAEGQWSGELEHSTRDGRRIVVESRHSLLRHEDRTLVFETSRDVSDRKRAEELRDLFIGMLSHELRTPVTAIYGGSQVLLRDGLDPNVRRDVLADVVAESERLERMVENLLVLARVERHAALLGEHEPVVVRTVIGRVVSSEGRRVPETRIEVRLAPGLPPIAADEGSVELVFRNLVANALKYGTRGGVITVIGSRVGDEVQVEVADDGPGLPAGEEALVFELFYRSADAKRRASGAGIGLYVTRALVEAMGGSIEADGAAGGGARFRVRLPIATETGDL